MNDRFVVVNTPEAAGREDAAAWGLEPGDYGSVLIDTKTDRIVFSDSMEPEDASLGRDLKPLVDLLNEVDKERYREGQNQ